MEFGCERPEYEEVGLEKALGAAEAAVNEIERRPEARGNTVWKDSPIVLCLVGLDWPTTVDKD